MNKDILEELKQLKSIADIGLLYSQKGYDFERYLEIQALAFRLINKVTGNSMEELRLLFANVVDYPTAKVDIRGLLLSPDQEQVLLVKEISDGKWSLPGGWADIGFSAAENMKKEFREETGLEVEVINLLAVFDKRMHPHPPEPYYVYKMVFHCTAAVVETKRSFDISDVRFFHINALPELSENRVLPSQLRLAYNKIIKGDYRTHFD